MESDYTLPKYDDNDATPSILPSYQMHQAILAKTINLPLSTEPAPTYALLDSSYDNASLALSTTSVSIDSDSNSFDYFSDAALSLTSDEDESSHCGSKILDVHHHLGYSKYISCIKLSVHLVDESGATIDPNSHEYTLNDVINGYITVENTSSSRVPFTMFYIFLEGNINTHNVLNSKISKINNFLQIIDLAGSSKYEGGHLSDLQFELGDNNFLDPGTRYKKYFLFRVPSKLLDSNCNHGHLPAHLELPSSMELSQKRSSHNSNLTFQNISITYNINVKCISPDLQTNTYSILQESSQCIRLVSQRRECTKLEELIQKSQSKYDLEKLSETVENYISLGKVLLGLQEPEPVFKFQHELSTSNDHLDHLQGSNFMTSFPYSKKVSILGKEKTFGELKVDIPIKEYEVSYIKPKKFRSSKCLSKDDLKSWNIDVPIELTFSQTSASSVRPELKNVTAKLVSASFISDKQHIPLEISHDMVFDNYRPKENFASLVREKFKSLTRQFSEQYRVLKTDSRYRVEKHIVEGIQCLGNLRSKIYDLEVKDIEISSPDYTSKNKKCDWKNTAGNEFSQNLNIHLDLTSAVSAGLIEIENSFSFDSYALTPSFQNCLISRLYYIQVDLQFDNGRTVTSKFPMSIVN